MKAIVFDTGPIITLTMNNLLWLLEPLKQKFRGEFYITPAVKRELIDTPIKSKKFKFEALQVLREIEHGNLKVSKENVKDKTLHLMDIANHIFKVRDRWMNIIHYAEMEAMMTALHTNTNVLAVDERTTRMMIEYPRGMELIFEKKLHAEVKVDNKNLREFKSITKGIKMIRSTELALLSYEMGLLNKYLPKIPKPRKQLLQSILWGMKLRGCAITRREIDSIISEELQKR